MIAPRLFGLMMITCSVSLVPMAASAEHDHEHGTEPVFGATAEASQFSSAQSVATAITWHLSPLSRAFDLPGAPTRGTGGMASGDALAGSAVWSSFSFARSENDDPTRLSGGNNQNLSLGIDRPLNEKLTAGISLSFTHDDTDTTYNAGTSTSRGLWLAPYLNYAFNDWLSLEASLGYGVTDNDVTQNIPGSAVTGTYDSKTTSASIALSAAKWYDKTLVSGRFGLNGSHTRQEAYTQSDGTFMAASSSSVTQASLSGTVAWWMEPAMPYATLEYAADLSNSSALAAGQGSNGAWKVTVGSNFYGQSEGWQNATGGVALSHKFGSNEEKTTELSANLRWQF